jgi:hypothetical protein
MQLGIDMTYQLVRVSACFLCVAEKHQYLERYFVVYPQIEAAYPQLLVDAPLHYK